MADKEDEYFLGSIVATADDDIVEVVDGQQRLATTMILIAAIRDWHFEQKDVETAAELELELLQKKDRRTKEIHPKLMLNDVDDGYFRDRILSRPDSPERKQCVPIKSSHKRIDTAAKLARQHVNRIAHDSKTPADRLYDLLDYLQHHAKVIWLTATDSANAFVIFETLNDRGLELATTDLLKNYLFSMAGDQLDRVQRSWISMISTLDTVAGDNAATEFLRHFWSSHHGPTRKHELYAKIKKKTRARKAVVDLADELERAANIYVAIVNEESSFWRTYGETSRLHMSTMNLLGMVQIRPLLLALLDEGPSVREVRKILRSMVSWGVRFLIVGGLGGGTLEKHYSDAALEVRSKKIETATKLRQFLQGVIPGDADFKNAFEVAKVSKVHLARYYLRALERRSNATKQPELVPNSNPDEVNLEHILPKNLDEGWGKTFTAEDHAALRYRIGNLALLAKEENVKSDRDLFIDKRNILIKSKFKLTQMVGKKMQWRGTEINARQKDLAKLAIETWKI